MRSRGFTCLLLGIWLGCGMGIYVAGVDLRQSVERTFRDANPGAALRIEKLGDKDSRLLLRFQTEQEYRYLTEVWTNVQFGLALLFFFYLLFGTGENKFILAAVLGLIVLVALERFFVIPEITGLGKLLDFVPDSDPSPSRGRYHVMQNTYLGMEMAKWATQAALGLYFSARSRRTSRNSGNQLNVVNKADYGHVDR